MLAEYYLRRCSKIVGTARLLDVAGRSLSSGARGGADRRVFVPVAIADVSGIVGSTVDVPSLRIGVGCAAFGNSSTSQRALGSG